MVKSLIWVQIWFKNVIWQGPVRDWLIKILGDGRKSSFSSFEAVGSRAYTRKGSGIITVKTSLGRTRM